MAFKENLYILVIRSHDLKITYKIVLKNYNFLYFRTFSISCSTFFLKYNLLRKIESLKFSVPLFFWMKNWLKYCQYYFRWPLIVMIRNYFYSKWRSHIFTGQKIYLKNIHTVFERAKFFLYCRSINFLLQNLFLCVIKLFFHLRFLWRNKIGILLRSTRNFVYLIKSLFGLIFFFITLKYLCWKKIVGVLIVHKYDLLNIQKMINRTTDFLYFRKVKFLLRHLLLWTNID